MLLQGTRGPRYTGLPSTGQLSSLALKPRKHGFELGSHLNALPVFYTINYVCKATLLFIKVKDKKVAVLKEAAKELQHVLR